MTNQQLPGQLSLLDPPEPKPKPAPTSTSTSTQPKRKRSPRVSWVGRATCRACESGLSIYRMDRRYWAWDINELVAGCPKCGVSVTTTTFDLRKAAA